MKDEDIFLRVKELKDEPEELGDYLLNLTKNNNNAIKYEEVYADLLSKDNWYLKKVGLYALLFTFKLKDENYISKAISFLTNSSEDDEVRRWSVSGLSVVYHGTREKRIFKIFYEILFNEKEDSSTRMACIEGVLSLLGISASEIYNRKVKTKGGGSYFNIDDNLLEFKNEIEKVRCILA